MTRVFYLRWMKGVALSRLFLKTDMPVMSFALSSVQKCLCRCIIMGRACSSWLKEATTDMNGITTAFTIHTRGQDYAALIC